MSEERQTYIVHEVEETDSRSETVKFAILVMVLLGVVLVVALSRPLIFGRMIPAVLGDGLPQADQQTEVEPPLEATPVVDEPVGEEAERPTAAPATAGPEAIPGETATAAPEVTAASPSPVQHLVQPGENLNRIARQYNVTVAAIVAANHIPNPNHIEAGTVLTIPQP